MDAKPNSADINAKMGEGCDGKAMLHDSQSTASKLSMLPDNSTAGPAGSSAEATTFSDEISTEDTELSSNDKSVKVLLKDKETDLHKTPKAGVTRAVSFSTYYVERAQPKPLCSLLPSSMESCTVCDGSQSFTSTTKTQENLKITPEPDPADLCAAILLGCLFCHPLDCLLALMRGCNSCVWSLCSSLCSSLCGCEPSTLQPVLDVTQHCDLCDALGVRRCLCECPICDLCFLPTECLDLAMEMSQMLYH